MKIILEKPKEIVMVAERKITITEIDVLEIIDNPSRKTVIASTLQAGEITIWEGREYSAMGQWTNDDVIASIKELYL
jgi:hypothetical protein